MAWILLLLLLKVLTCFSGKGALSDVTLSQPPSLSAPLKGPAELPCNISKGFYFGYSVWYQHKHGTSPKFLLYYNTTSGKTVFGSEVSDHFSVSTDAPKFVAYLNIKNVQAGDEADYYCGSWNRDGTAYVFGGGTQLTVTGGPPSPPTVNLYCPSKEEMASKGTGTLVCSITGFYPSAMLTTWEAGGTPISNGVQTTKPIKDNDKYMASSYLPVTAREWEHGNSYTCKVRHEEQDYMKSVSQSQCP